MSSGGDKSIRRRSGRLLTIYAGSFAGFWSRSRDGVDMYQRLVCLGLVSRKIVNVSVLSRSRPFTSRAQDQFSPKLCERFSLFQQALQRVNESLAELRPTRSRLLKANLSKLVFLNCNCITPENF